MSFKRDYSVALAKAKKEYRPLQEALNEQLFYFLFLLKIMFGA